MTLRNFLLRITAPTLLISTLMIALICGLRQPLCMPGRDLGDADEWLYLAILRGANLQGARLHGMIWTELDLRGADLSGADLSGACLKGVSLAGCDLRGAK